MRGPPEHVIEKETRGIAGNSLLALLNHLYAIIDFCFAQESHKYLRGVIILMSVPPPQSYAVIPQIKRDCSAGCYAYKIILLNEGLGIDPTWEKDFAENPFETDYKTMIGTSLLKKDTVVEESGAHVRFLIWDMAVEGKFKRAREAFFQNAVAGIVIFDVTQRVTFTAVEARVEEARRSSGKPDLALILVGNNAGDLERQVSYEEGAELGKRLGIPYIENAATAGDLSSGVFNLLARFLVKKHAV